MIPARSFVAILTRLGVGTASIPPLTSPNAKSAISILNFAIHSRFINFAISAFPSSMTPAFQIENEIFLRL